MEEQIRQGNEALDGSDLKAAAVHCRQALTLSQQIPEEESYDAHV